MNGTISTIGSLEIIIGPMFSGKTTELLRRVDRYQRIGKQALVINSKRDTRCGNEIKTHNAQTHSAVKVQDLSDPILKDNINRIKVVAIDEAQFFTDLVPFVKWCLYSKNLHVIISGLDGDFQQNVFGEILQLIPHAETCIKLNALCVQCNDGTPAQFSTRLAPTMDQELVGGSESYHAVCRKHLLKRLIDDTSV
jgi:thymidine kinase